jgi:hypothetical protein
MSFKYWIYLKIILQKKSLNTKTYLNKYYWKFEIYLNVYENNNVEKIFEYKND